MSGALTDTSILAGASGAGDYTIDQSCRFPATTKLQKTISGDGNRTTWTWSGWTKNSFNWNITADNSLFSAQHTSGGGSGRFNAYFRGELPNTYFECSEYTSSGYTTQLHTLAVYRDPAAWLHVVVVWDTDNGTETDRLRFYINGERITAFGTGGTSPNYPSSGEESSINNANCAQTIGALDGDTATSITSYLAEVHFIDGQALTAASFGETNVLTNQWVPKKYAGTYGTKGYYMKFEDSADLGNDSSGNGNDYTSTGLSATDQMTGESPTNNFCTFNPLLKSYLATTFTEGNLSCRAGSGWVAVPATFSLPAGSGKWYWEYAQSTSNARYYVVGNNSSKFFDDGINPQQGDSAIGFLSDGNKAIDNTETSYGTSWASDATTAIISCALNLDDDEVTWYKNGVSQGAISFSGNIVNADFVVPFAVGAWYGDTNTWVNFGADSSFAGRVTAQGNQDSNGIGDFYYAVPSGYLALCTSNLPDPAIKLPGDNFNTVLYDGNGVSGQTISGVGFQSDFSWIKSRSMSQSNTLVDVLRGSVSVRYDLRSNSSDAEDAVSTDKFGVFNSDGFTLIGGSSQVNNATATYVAWNWLAGGSGVANTTGTIDALVSANTTAGFSIVKFDQEGTGAAATIGHGLSQRPELVIGKPYDTADAWRVGSDYQASSVDWEEILQLQSTGAAGPKDGVFDGGNYPGGPTASIIYLGDDGLNNSGYESVLYCFHSVEGYSKIGQYQGNGEAAANAPFVYCGFRPAWVMIKRWQTASQNWMIYDNKRSTYNVIDDYLQANTSDDEEVGSTEDLDFLSNGFRIRTDQTEINPGGGAGCIFLAFAEFPFKYSNAR